MDSSYGNIEKLKYEYVLTKHKKILNIHKKTKMLIRPIET